MSFKLTIKDRGLNELERQWSKTQAPMAVTAGIHEAEGRAAKEELDGKSATPLIDVASNHEFGITVPQRSFVGACVDENAQDLESKLTEHMRKVALKSGREGVKVALGRFGQYVVGLMQQRIADGIAPELDPKYAARKAKMGVGPKDTPLILTGQLRSSIRAKVEG